jgi:hypothetical protein
VHIRIGVENGNDGRSLAWALDYPGCFVYGPDESAVILNLPNAFIRYAEWVGRHTDKSWVKTNSLDIELIEVWQCYFIDDGMRICGEGIEVNAWFRDDWRPLTKLDIIRGKLLSGWTREDLLTIAHPLTKKQIDLSAPGAGSWTIQRILQHIANAEWWYLNRLDLAPWKKSDLPEESFSRLNFVHAHVMDVLDDLSGLEKVVGKEGEFWSPRKLLRRLLYHERDHLDHILQILAKPN